VGGYLQAFERRLLRLQVVLVLLVIRLMSALLEGFRVYGGNLPRQLDGNLLSLSRQLVYS
jgi:hypothetical protein